MAVSLGKLALALTQAGYEVKANLLFTQAREVIQTINSSHGKVWSLGSLAISLTQAGYETLAGIALAEAKEAVNENGARCLVKLMAHCRRFADAREVAEMIQDEKQKLWALNELAEELAQFKQFPEAEKVAQEIRDCFLQAGAFTKIAKAMGNAKLIENARFFFAIAEAIIPIIEDLSQRAIVIIELAKAMVNAGVNDGNRIFSEASKTIQAIERTIDRDCVLMEYVDGHPELDLGIEVGAISWEDERKQKQNLDKLVAETAQAQRFSEALTKYSEISIPTYSSELDEFLVTLGSWASAFDRVETRLSLIALQEQFVLPVGYIRAGRVYTKLSCNCQPQLSAFMLLCRG